MHAATAAAAAAAAEARPWWWHQGLLLQGLTLGWKPDLCCQKRTMDESLLHVADRRPGMGRGAMKGHPLLEGGEATQKCSNGQKRDTPVLRLPQSVGTKGVGPRA